MNKIKALTNTNLIVEAEKLTASYGSKIIWENANFTVNKGEFVVLLGPNGGGKTTLFRLILGLIKPQEGDLKLFKMIPTRGNPKIGYIPQRRPIDSDVKIEALEFVKLGLVTGWGIDFTGGVKEEKKALDILKQINSEDLAHRSMGELSGGELQRVFLAQALVSEPDLLLLDEPLASLDIRRELEFVALLNEVLKTRNIAIMLITHDINPLLEVTDKIIYIANGRVETGNINEIINSKKLSELYNVPVEVLRDSHGRVAVLGIEGEVHHE